MAHIHSVYDSEQHFLINPTTRAIVNQEPQKTTLIQYDHNSERFTFEIPRMVDGHDMSTCNKVEVHYLNIEAKTGEQNAGVYIVDDLQVFPEDNDVVILSWLISQNATQLIGSLNFLVSFKCVTDANIDYAWNTAICSSIAISTGIYNSEIIVEQYADVLEQWKKEILNGGIPTGATGEPNEDDIPKVFFGGALQQTKDEAVVPFRYISKTQDVKGYAEIKAQGNSSMSYPKKNQTVKFFKDAECVEKLKVDFKEWGKQNKFCFKANWIDLTHARNVVSARLWADVVKSRANYTDLPELLRTSPNQGAVDGFPVKVYAGGVYQGRYTINIPKDKWMSNMDDDLEKHCILCGENYASGCFRALANINGSDWTDEIHDTVPASIKTRWNEVISFVMNSTDEEFKANLGNYFYVDSLIDYHLFGLLSCGLDAYGKNQLYMTYDGLKWLASMYDMDSTWGLYWNGSKFVATDYGRANYEDLVSGRQGNLLYIRFEQLFHNELKNRWTELKNGALSIDNIINRFERFIDIAPIDLVKEDYASTTGEGKFTGIPSKDTNNIQQIRTFALARQSWTDNYINALAEDDSGEGEGGETPPEDATLTSIEATYSGGNVAIGTDINSLTGIVVTAKYSDGTSTNVTSYTLSGTIAEGNNTITISYGGLTTTITVIGENEEPTLLYSLQENTVFDGVDDYIDTGIKLYEKNKDFTVFIDLSHSSTVANFPNATIFSTMKEINPYPGFVYRVRNNAVELASGSVYKNLGSVIDKSFNAGSARFKLVVTHSKDEELLYVSCYRSDSIINTSLSCAHEDFDLTAILGAGYTNTNTLQRYWGGIIHTCNIYNYVLNEEEINTLLDDTVDKEIGITNLVWSESANGSLQDADTGNNYVTTEYTEIPTETNGGISVVLANANNNTFTYLGVAQYDENKTRIEYSEDRHSNSSHRVDLCADCKYVRFSAFPNNTATNIPSTGLTARFEIY